MEHYTRRRVPARSHIKAWCDTGFFLFDPSRGRGVLQVKTTNPDTFAKEWDGGEFIPEWIIDQTLTEALLSEAEFAAVAVWVVERYEVNVHIIDLPIDLARQARIVAAVAKFCDDVWQAASRSPTSRKMRPSSLHSRPRRTRHRARSQRQQFACPNSWPAVMHCMSASNRTKPMRSDRNRTEVSDGGR